jgi:hypothetical protein
MNKKIITNALFDYPEHEGPESGIIEIDEALAKKIHYYANLVKENDMYKAETFDYSATWFNAFIDWPEDGSPEALEKEIRESGACRTECDSLCIYSDGFKWTAVPKHGNGYLRFQSHIIPLEFLTDNRPVLVVN